MTLKSLSLAQSEIAFSILEENAHWLLSKEIFQWPLEWLDSKKTELRHSVAEGYFYFIETEDEISGIVEIKELPEEVWGNDASKALYIHKLAVRRKYSRRNLGRTILLEIRKKAMKDGAKYIRLDCVAHNIKLRGYYESRGFLLKRTTNNGSVELALYERMVKN